MVLTVGPGHTLRQAAAQMAERSVGAAVVLDPETPRAGHPHRARRAACRSAAGQDPDTERVAEHLTAELVFAAPDWSLEQAAVAMVRGGFRHLIVIEGGEIAGSALRARHRALLDRRRRVVRGARRRRRSLRRGVARAPARGTTRRA